MLIYGKGGRNGKSLITSEKTIKLNHEDGEDGQEYVPKSKNLMMKTANVFKDYKLSPYFHLSSKKPLGKMPAKSLSRIPTNTFTEKSEVSIEIASD